MVTSQESEAIMDFLTGMKLFSSWVLKLDWLDSEGRSHFSGLFGRVKFGAGGRLQIQRTRPWSKVLLRQVSSLSPMKPLVSVSTFKVPGPICSVFQRQDRWSAGRWPRLLSETVRLTFLCLSILLWTTSFRPFPSCLVCITDKFHFSSFEKDILPEPCPCGRGHPTLRWAGMQPSP